jgi:hypothetical protein
MESGDHSKNGASPKNLTSRRNVFKASDRRGCKLKSAFIATIVALCLIVAFPSCDDAPDSIVGTTWVCNDIYFTVTIHFKSESICVIQSTEYNDLAHQYIQRNDIFEQTYTYNPPNVYIQDNESIIKGVIQDASMIITAKGYQGIFIRQ